MRSDTLKSTIRYHAVRRGKVTLSSGKESDLYFDLRAIPLGKRFWREAAKRVRACIGEYQMVRSYVAGVDYGGVPLALAVSFLAPDGRALVIRDKGGAVQIHGAGDVAIEGQRIIIVDDVASTGDSIIRAACEFRRRGAEVALAVVMVERDLGARHELGRAGIKLHALFHERDFIGGAGQ